MWVGGLVPAPAYLADGTKPTLALWHGPCGQNVGASLASTQEAPTQLREILTSALEEAKETGSAPAELHLTSEEALDALSGVRDLPPLSVVDGGFHEVVAFDQMAQIPELYRRPSYLEPGLDRVAVREMIEAGASFAAAVPLREGDPQAVRVHAPTLGLHNACVWIGEEVLVARGLLIFDCAEAYEDAMRVGVRYTHIWSDGSDQSHLSLEFGGNREFPTYARELGKLGIRRRRCPEIPVVDAYDMLGARRPTTPADLQRVTCVARALADAYPKLRESGTHLEPESRRVAVSVNTAIHSVEVTYPHPQVDAELLALSNCYLDQLAMGRTPLPAL